MCTSMARSGTSRTDSMTELEFELADAERFPVGLCGDGDCEVRLEETIRPADDTVIEFFTARGCTAEALRERAADAPAVEAVRSVSEEQDRVVLQVVRSERCVAETVERAGAIPGSVTASDGTGRLVLHVPGNVDPGEVIDAVLERHPAWTFVARRPREHSAPVFTPRGVQQVLREQPTDRQWEVLRSAYLNGYFERPRGRTGEEVADDLDISSATFSQHLRSALRNVLSSAIDDGFTARNRS